MCSVWEKSCARTQPSSDLCHSYFFGRLHSCFWNGDSDCLVCINADGGAGAGGMPGGMPDMGGAGGMPDMGGAGGPTVEEVD